MLPIFQFLLASLAGIILLDAYLIILLTLDVEGQDRALYIIFGIVAIVYFLHFVISFIPLHVSAGFALGMEVFWLICAQVDEMEESVFYRFAIEILSAVLIPLVCSQLHSPVPEIVYSYFIVVFYVEIVIWEQRFKRKDELGAKKSVSDGD